eukprot:jgi/Psemu1/34194/gm1.34194_g
MDEVADVNGGKHILREIRTNGAKVGEVGVADEGRQAARHSGAGLMGWSDDVNLNDVQNPLQTPQFGPDKNIPVPRNGGNGYAEDTRTTPSFDGELGRLINNIESLPAARIARRHKRQVRELGKNVRFRHSGNKHKEDIIELPMLLLGVYQKIYPKATRYECLAFLDDMIDVDETGIKLEHANKKMGKCSLCGRVQQRGNYGHGVNHTLKMAIAAGTDVFSFAAFIESILEDLPPGTDGNRKCFIVGNLLAHHNPLTLDAIVDARHRFIFRAPYYPVDGLIKYVVNTIEMALSYQMYEISNIGNLH